MNNIFPTLQFIELATVFKILVLLVIAFYAVFSFILMTQVRSLSRIVYVHDAYGSRLMFFLTVLYFIASISLFVAALVIL